MLIERKHNIMILENYLHKIYAGDIESLQLIKKLQIFRIQLHNVDGEHPLKNVTK